jgi:hypothetical protein
MQLMLIFAGGLQTFPQLPQWETVVFRSTSHPSGTRLLQLPQPGEHMLMVQSEPMQVAAALGSVVTAPHCHVPDL